MDDNKISKLELILNNRKNPINVTIAIIKKYLHVKISIIIFFLI